MNKANFLSPATLIPRPSFIYKKFKSYQDKEELNQDILKNILFNYDFELIKISQKTTEGNRGNNYILKTSKGYKLIKFYRKTLDRLTIIQEHSILRHLNKIGFPSPVLNIDNSERTLLRHKNNFFALFDFVESGFHYNNYYSFPNQKIKFIASSGKILGILHNKLENFSPEGYNPDGFKSKKEDRYRNRDWFINKLNYCIKETIDLNEGTNEYPLSWMIRNIGSLEDSLTQLDIRLLEFNLPRLIIHGDYGPYNLLFFKNKKIMVLDFEMARLDWRLTEIIRAWHRFCLDRFGFNMKKMLIFLNNYDYQASLKFNEIDLVPDIWEFLSIRNAIKSWYKYCILKKKKFLVNISKSISSLKWIKKNRTKLLESLKHIHTI